MIKTLQKHGDSRALVIDRALMEAMGIEDDTPLEVNLGGRNLLVTPAADVGVGPDRVRASIEKMRGRYGSMLRSLAE